MGADDTSYAFHEDSYRWLADTDLLEMLLDKLGPLVNMMLHILFKYCFNYKSHALSFLFFCHQNSSEAHVNTADALSAVSRLSQSELAAKLSSPRYLPIHDLNFFDYTSE